jgi:hypothetical protein
MRSASVSFAVWGLAALCFVNSVNAQEQRGRVFRTEIYNGGTRTVRYNAAGLSPGESQSLRELERLENETSYLRSLEELKKEYVASERVLEPYRRSVQQMEYGVDRTMSVGGYAGGWGYNPGVYAGWGGFPSYAVGAYGWGGYGAYAPMYGTRTVTRSLAAGMGDEGVMKANISRTIAAQATEEYATIVDRSGERALARASASPTLRVALGMPADRGTRPDGGTRPAAAAERTPVTLTLTSGETVRGVKLEEKGNWFIVTLAGGKTLRLRESEVSRIETAPSGTKPASD